MKKSFSKLIEPTPINGQKKVNKIVAMDSVKVSTVSRVPNSKCQTADPVPIVEGR